MRKKIIIAMWVVLLSVIGGVVGLLFMVNEGMIGYMPDMQALSNPVDKFASQIVTSDGKLMGTYSYGATNRLFTEYDSIAPAMVEALVATEDERFYDHSGIDFRALLRAVVKRGVMGQKSAGGGSTITQQLAKQLYSEHATSTMQRLLQKPIEWLIAVKLERYYTKQEIITMYLNYFDFLHNAVGIKTASRTYFNKEPHELTVDECAMLVGMCKNPSYFNPVRVPERAQERRDVVLDQMAKVGYLSESDAEMYKAKPLSLNFHRVEHNTGIGCYVKEYLRQILMANKPDPDDYAGWQKQKYTEDSIAWEQDPIYGWCNKNVDKNGNHYNLYTDGLKITCSLDSRMQQYAEEAMYEHVVKYLQPIFNSEQVSNPNKPYFRGLSAQRVAADISRAKKQSGRYVTMKAAGYSESEIENSFNVPVEMTVYTPRGDVDTVMTPLDSLKYYKGFLHSGFVCMDSETGDVKAYVGGLDYTHFRYDMAGQGRRQVGSTMKPYLYAMAMDNGYGPDDRAPNVQKTYHLPGGGYWTPRNGSRACYGQMVTLKWALARSNNWVSAWLMSQLDPGMLVDLVHEFGIRNYNIKPNMTLALGSCEISVLEMVSAYTAFAHQGMRRAPRFVTKIQDSDGHVIANFQPQIHHVISSDAAWKMVILMQGVVNGGTGSRMRRMGVTAPMAGKTGTTNDNTDGWFVGYTPRLSFGAWVGGDERDVHFASGAIGQGAAAALPICAYFLKKVYADKKLGYSPNERFEIPEGLKTSRTGDRYHRTSEDGDAEGDVDETPEVAPGEVTQGGADDHESAGGAQTASE